MKITLKHIVIIAWSLVGSVAGLIGGFIQSLFYKNINILEGTFCLTLVFFFMAYVAFDDCES